MQLQPSCSDFKGSYSIWLLSPKFSTKGGSKVWHHITQFWKVMASTVAYFSLWISEEILQHNIWLRMNTKVYTLALLREGFLPCIGKDWGTFGIFGIMEGMNFWNGRLTKLNSPLLEFTMTFGLSYWSSTNLFKRWCLISQQSAQLTSHEWVGLFRNTEDALPEWVVNTNYLKEFSSGHVHFSTEFMSIFLKIYCWLAILHPYSGESDTTNGLLKLDGTCKRG